MIVTEEEAKTKRCQEGFGPSSDKMAEIDSGLWTQPSYCIGSACMAWRWLDQTVFWDEHRKPDAPGYCGKAGRPQERA